MFWTILARAAADPRRRGTPETPAVLRAREAVPFAEVLLHEADATWGASRTGTEA